MEAEARSAWEAAREGHGLPFTTACIAPWVALEFDPEGWVYACCANQTYRLGRAGHDRLADLWNGERMQVLRDALRDWDLSVGCQACRWHFEHARMDPDAAVYEGYRVDRDDPIGPRAMTFALSNRCNLGCVMCNPALSSTIRHKAGIPPLAARYDDTFFDDLAMYLPFLDYAKFLGGEPFLVPEHHRVWDLMREVGGPPRIQVTTNGTIWNDRVESVLGQFITDITISIDGMTAQTYESIRRGARHADVMANVERFRAACATSGALLRFCFCLMADNWHELGSFLHWADSLDVPVSVNVVSDDGFALHDLPPVQLDEVARAWAAEEAMASGPHTVNLDVWQTQLRQLDAIREEHAAGHPPRSKQPTAPTDVFTTVGVVDALEGAGADAVVADQRARLRRWSSGGPVAELHVGDDRVIREVTMRHPRLGLVPDALVGRQLESLVAIMSAADGRPIWALDLERFPSHVVRMLGLSTKPVRDNPASMVRTIEIPHGSGAIVLVAEDRLLDERAGLPVAVAVPAPVRAPPR